MTQKVLLTLPDEIYEEIDERRNLIPRNTYINFLLRIALALADPVIEQLKRADSAGDPSKETTLALLREYLKTPPNP